MTYPTASIDQLSDRARAVFRALVETYLQTGAPVGSRTLTRSISENVSAATIRNVMQDLEYMGLLGSPHTSAGRIPTQGGLRLFVDGFIEFSDPDDPDRARIDETLRDPGDDVAGLLDRVGQTLSGVTQGASLVLTPKHEAPVRHIEFLSLAPDRALIVLVFADGQVENRVFAPPPGQTPSSLQAAANFINGVAAGGTLTEISACVRREISARRAEIDSAASSLIEAGIAQWANEGTAEERLIVRGRGNLIDGTPDETQLDRIKTLFDDLERKRDIAEFLELAEQGEGVRIFIGSENQLFSLTGSSLVVSPYMNADQKVIGAVGVIGPTRLNYGRIVPIVDYTAQLVGRLMSERG